MAASENRIMISDKGDSYSALAYATISGGQFVKAVSGDAVLTASNALDNVLNVDLADDVGTDDVLVVGVAANTVASGERVTVLTTGIHGFKADAAVTAGALVKLGGAAASEADSVRATTADAGSKAIGRALGPAGSGQLAPILLRV